MPERLVRTPRSESALRAGVPTAQIEIAPPGLATSPAGPPRWIGACLVGALLALPIGIGLVPLIVVPAVAALAVVVSLALILAPDRVRRRLRGPVALVALICVTLTAVDLGARMFLLPALHPRPDTLLGRHHPAVPAPQLRPDSEFDRDTFGDLALLTGVPEHREPRHVTLTTDEFGYRNSGAPAAPVELVLIGDSFGLGSGTTQDDTWAARLGESRAVYNLSPPWGSPWEQLATATAELDRLELAPGATVVWSLFAGNDLDDTYLPRFRRDEIVEGPSRALKTWFHDAGLQSPLRTVVERVGAGLSAMPGRLPPVLVGEHEVGSVLFFRDYVERSRRGRQELREHANHELLRRTIAAMRDLTAERDLRLVVALVPTKSDVYPDLVPDGHRPTLAFQRELKLLTAEFDLPCLDLRPALVQAAAENPDRLVYWRDDSHWNPHGHTVAARAVERFLADLAKTP